MRLSNLISLYRLRLPSMLVQELLAIAGIAVGVALVFAALVANTSLTGSIRQLTDGVVGSADMQLMGRGPHGFDERMVAKVQRVDGVEAAAPIVEARANVVGPAGRRSILLFGGDTRFVRLGDAVLPNFSSDELTRTRGLALPTPLAEEIGVSFGQAVLLEVGRRIARLPVGAQLQERDIGPLVSNPVALAPLALVQRVAGMAGRVTRVFVRAAPGRRAGVKAALERIAGGRANVVPADAEVAIFEQAAYPTSQSTTLFSVLSALVGFLFAVSAVLLTVPRRRAFAADLRAAGHEGWVIVQQLLFDAVVLGVVASVLGLALGDQLSRHLFDSAPDYLSAAFAVGSERIVTAGSVAIAAGAGLLAACVAVLVPVRAILGRHPLGPPAPAEDPTSGIPVAAAGFACLAATTGVLAVAPEAAIVGLVALTLALLLLLPVVLRGVLAVFERAAKGIRSAAPTLAVMELRDRSARTRTLALGATGAVAVFATVAIGGAHADLERGLDESARQVDNDADVWVSFTGRANTLATTPFGMPGWKLAALERIPGVRRVARYRGSFLDIGDHRVWVIAPPRTAPSPVSEAQLVDGNADEATARLRAGGWAVLSEVVADTLGVGVGDAVTVPSPRPTTLRVAAVSSNLGWPPGAVMLNADDYARAWDTEAVSALQIDVAPSAAAAGVAARVERVVDAGPFRVETQRERVERHYASTDNGLARLTQISILVLIAAILALVSTMAGTIWQRRSALARSKVMGIDEVQLWKALMLEGALLLGTGCAMGALFGLYGQALLSRALQAITGFPVIYSVAGLLALATLALVLVVVVAVLAIPGWLATRVRPAPGVPT